MGIITSILLKPFSWYYWYTLKYEPKIVRVETGDVYGSGTDANVWIKLYSKANGVATEEIHLDLLFRDDFERGNIDDFPIPPLPEGFGDVDKIEIWRDDAGFGSSWYVDNIQVIYRESSGDTVFTFPIHRWIKGHTRYFFSHLDCVLPCADEHREQRKGELKVKRAQYELARHHPALPVQIKELPEDESFSDSYKWDIVTNKMSFKMQAKVANWKSTDTWKSFDDLKTVYGGMLPLPKGASKYMGDEDFGRQRLAGCNCILISLCTRMPEKLAVNDDMLKPFLEGLSINEAIRAKRLFFTDLNILEGIAVNDGNKLCQPIALFFVNYKQDLMPVAIQLKQEPCEDNPVFLPSDPTYTWQLAKMWYNNADAMYHQSITHLAFTHLLMESVAVCIHRTLSPSHPIYKLMAPHFLFLLAINTRGLKLLLAPGEWIDKTMTIGVEGCLQLIGKGCDMWRMDLHGTAPKEFEARGVLDQSVLPHYYFRDDCLVLYKAIHKYVSAIIAIYYESDAEVRDDEELQEMVQDLTADKDGGGMGIKGVPGNGSLNNRQELIDLCTSLVYACSVSHAGANFAQYDDYGFPPYYPGLLKGEPPTDKTPRTEQDLVDTLPSKSVTLDTMVVTKLLSMKSTKSLGDFEFKYLYHSKCKKVIEEFQAELDEIGKVIDNRNKKLAEDYKYDVLHPVSVPNSISI